MKVKTLFSLVFLAGFVILTSNIFSQETKTSKKVLDAFINATTKSTGEPVPGAEIVVELAPQKTTTKTAAGPDGNMEIVGLGFEKKLKYKSNEKGEFSFSLPIEQFKKLPEEFHLKLTINPEDPDKFPVETNTVVLKVKKAYGPKLEFIVTYQQPKERGNKGSFMVNTKAYG